MKNNPDLAHVGHSDPIISLCSINVPKLVLSFLSPSHVTSSVDMNLASFNPLLVLVIMMQFPFSHGFISENLLRLCVMVTGKKFCRIFFGHP